MNTEEMVFSLCMNLREEINVLTETTLDDRPVLHRMEAC